MKSPNLIWFDQLLEDLTFNQLDSDQLPENLAFKQLPKELIFHLCDYSTTKEEK